MTTQKGYNGWTNYETWATKLWLDNDQGSYDYWCERTEELVGTGMPEPAHPLAQELRDTHEEALPELQGFASDLLRGAFSEINWYEIAESLIEDYQAENAS